MATEMKNLEKHCRRAGNGLANKEEGINGWIAKIRLTRVRSVKSRKLAQGNCKIPLSQK